MIEVADANGVKLMIAYLLHFEEANLEAIEVAKSGKLGHVRIFDSVFSQQVAAGNVRVTEPVENGGGPVYDMGVYCINAARYLFRAEPTSVIGFSARHTGERFERVDEMTSVVMRFPEERLRDIHVQFWRGPCQPLQSDRNQRCAYRGAGIRLFHGL